MAGRKSKYEELAIAQRYADLSVKAFEVLKDNLENGNKADKKWAVEQLSKGFVKMIPQEITGKDGKDLIPQPILSGLTSNTSIYVPANQRNPEDSKAPETH